MKCRPFIIPSGFWSLLRPLGILLLLYVSWLAMLAVHELGHVIHAYLSGGRVSLVYFHPLDFSRTDLSTNPHPQFVAWGGPIWGSMLPLLVYALICRLCPRFSKPARFFAGFCLIVNGVYIGLGWIDRAGDAGTLLRTGAAPWAMMAAGLLAIASGLYLWHRLGPRFGLTRPVR